jgi:hypothetical protein
VIVIECLPCPLYGLLAGWLICRHGSALLLLHVNVKKLKV